MKKSKWAKLMTMLSLVLVAATLLAACGEGNAAAQIVGVYGKSGSNYSTNNSSTSRLSASTQTLTLYDDNTYSLVTTSYNVTVSSAAPGGVMTLTVFGTYELKAETAATEDEYATKTISLSDINKSIWSYNLYPQVLGYMNTVLSDPETYPVGSPTYNKYIGYSYPGNSDTFEADKKAAALEYFNIKTKEVTVTEVTGAMSTGIEITLCLAANLDKDLVNVGL